MKPSSNSTVAQTFASVNTPVNSQLPLFSDNLIHHNVSPYPHRMIVSFSGKQAPRGYGVSSSHRVLTTGLFNKKYDLVRDCLQYVLGLTTAQRCAVLRLLRYWSYYGQVYPKESAITTDPGCSKATFWRTVKLLKSKGLISVTNRFIIRPHAQISNLYRFDRLLILIACYLAEHGTCPWGKWIDRYLRMPARLFYDTMLQGREFPSYREPPDYSRSQSMTVLASLN